MPVLDGSMVQVEFGGRRPARVCVFLPDSSHVLLGRLFADAQAPGHRLDGHARRIQPQRARFLDTQRWPVRRVVGGEDAGQARRNPVRSGRHRPDGRPQLGSLLVLEDVAARPSPATE